MKTAIIHEGAKQELDRAIAYYEEQKNGLGLDLLSEIEQTLEKRKRNPKTGTPYRISGTRRYILRRFPFSIFYVEFEAFIWIVAIAHGKRKADYWKKRVL